MDFFIEHEHSPLGSDQVSNYTKAVTLFKAAHFGYSELGDTTTEVTLSSRENDTDPWTPILSRLKHLIIS